MDEKDRVWGVLEEGIGGGAVHVDLGHDLHPAVWGLGVSFWDLGLTGVPHLREKAPPRILP